MSSNLNNRVQHVQATEVYDTSGVRVYFENIEEVVCEAIAQAEEVVACVAWLKSRPILAALQAKPSTVIVTSDRVHRSNRASLMRIPPRTGFRAVSIVGVARGRFRPLMHNKFIVLLREQRPYAVLTGSYNFTAHSKVNLENIMLINSPEVARVYYREAMAIYAISRQL